MAFISNGTTILDNGAFQASLGSMVLLSEQTASNVSSVEFTSGIDSTYPIYIVKIINLFSHTDDRVVLLNFTTDGTNFNVTKTTTFFRARHNESDSLAGLDYRDRADLAQSTSGQEFVEGFDGEADANVNSTIFLYNPSSTTFVKHFTMYTQGTGNGATNAQTSTNAFVGGYCNTTSAVTGFRVEGSSTTISGTFKLYGIKDS